MSDMTNTMISAETLLVEEMPADLRSWLSAPRVLELAIDAAEAVTQGTAFRDGCFENFSVPTMLTLLGFCYATDSVASEDVERALSNKTVLRHIRGACVRNAVGIRRFRRAHRPLLLQCLVHLLTQAKAEQAGEKTFEPAGSETSAEIEVWAARKIELAILMDAAAAD
jgi:hypothetical protein